MAAALKGNATDIEIANMKQSIRSKSSPKQMMGVMKEGMGILADKANTAQERYKVLMPDDDYWSPILPTAKAVLDKYGVKTVAQEMNKNKEDLTKVSTEELLRRLSGAKK